MAQAHISAMIVFSPRLRKSPFFAATQRYGCKAYTVYNHKCLPTYYEDPVAEFWRLVNDVTLWDVACERQVEITGPDAARFVQHLTPRNLSNCAVGLDRWNEGGIMTKRTGIYERDLDRNPAYHRLLSPLTFVTWRRLDSRNLGHHR